jgi:hypothetical protein
MKRQVRLAMVGLLVNSLLTWTTPAALADTPGTWKSTGSMATSRRHSQVSPMPDGRISVVGGTNTTGVDGTASIFYDSAEIYDPLTATWAATGSLTTGGRALHAMTELWGGKILVTGGWNGSGALSSAEIYDPATGTFSATGSMNTARANHRQRALYDGRVLITGGFDSSRTPIVSAEIYDPTTGGFSPTAGPMAAARYVHFMNTVGDGKVLVTGGFGTGGIELPTAELFDPATGTFTAAGSLAQARANHNATVLPTGEVLVTGGHGGGGVLSSTEIYDPETSTFTAGPALIQARQSHSAYPLPNGLVLISGGNNNASGDWDIQTNFLSSAELYDLAAQTFTTTGSKTNATCNGNTILLWNGKLLITGGGTNQAELYTPEMTGTPETWVAAGNMVTPRSNAIFTYLDDGRVIAIGGLDSAGNPMASTELYDYLTGRFTPTGSMATPRQHHYVYPLYTGKVLVMGGRPNATTNVLDSAELFDPVTGTFTPTGDMLRYRRLHRATELPNGKILITGGLGGTSNTANSLLNGAELYDPATGTFTFTTGSMITARYNHLSAPLYTGKVLIAAGYGTGSVLVNSAELYDPVTGTFTATGNMITGRSIPLFNRLPNGKILVSGGSDTAGAPIQAMEIYDPATGTFAAAGNAAVARYFDRVSRLDNGKLVFVGGQTTADTSSVTNSADLYDHTTGKFSTTGGLITGRRNFAQWILPNGRILVAGGFAANGTVLSSAELYTPLIADVFSSPYFDTVQKVYIGYYQRPADPGGLIYWADRLDKTGGNLNEIIEAYANSPESQALYGTINSGTISNVVNAIYNTLFGRNAESGGLNFYVNGFNSGQFTAATIMLNVLYGSQNQDLQSINNKLAAANLFTRTIDPELDGMNFQVTYAGEGDAIKARTFLASVTADPATVPTKDGTAMYMKSNIADPGDPILNP